MRSEIADGENEGEHGRVEAQDDDADVEGCGEEGRGSAFHPAVQSVAMVTDVADVEDREDEGSDSDEDGPKGDEEIGQGSIDDGRVASHIFQDVEPVSLNDIG